ncbi:MAG: hypothetical protein AAF708_15960, partial [Deinococcota bacterium]
MTPHTTQIMKAILDATWSQACWAVATLKQAASKVAEHFKLRRLVTGLEARATNIEQISTRQSATRQFIEADCCLNESLRANRNNVWYRNDIHHLSYGLMQLSADNANATTTQGSTASPAENASLHQLTMAKVQGVFKFIWKGGGCSRQQSCTNAGEMQPAWTLRKLGH